MANYAKTVLADILIYWRAIVTIVTPLLLLPLPLKIGTVNANCAYVVILMAVYWMAEVVPLAVTSFIPIFLFPFLGVLSVADTCAEYLKDTNFLFVAGLIVALGVEESNLHKRIALRVLLIMGSRPRWLMLGFMSVTAFLSMWMSNTATTAMMVPIAVTVLDEIVRHDNKHRQSALKIGKDIPDVAVLNSTETLETDLESAADLELQNRKFSVSSENGPVPAILNSDGKFNMAEMSKFQKGICKATLLGICYSANIGGTGTLTGTGPNLILKGQLDSFYPGGNTGITFASWLGFAVPALIVCLVVAWLWLQIAFLGLRNFFSCCQKKSTGKSQDDAIRRILRREYDSLGSMSFAEGSVLFWFLILVGLWIFRQPEFIEGWDIIFTPKYVSNSSPGMLIACILFAWPKYPPDFICFRKDKSQKAQRSPPIMDWAVMQKKFPWAVIMLLGGGFALARGVKDSGLSNWVGCSLQAGLASVPTAGIIAIFTIIITFLTEVSSNSATASIFIPILFAAAENLKVNPLYFALPGTISPSFAFMLPVATPPNAIVYETGVVRIIDMMMVGVVMNFLCIGVTLLNINTFASWYYNLGEYPSWAFTNSTVQCP